MRIDTYFAIFIIVWVAALLPTVYWEVVTLDVTHSYVLPSASCTGRLTSNRWDFQTIREGLLLCMYVLFPFSLVFMIWTRERIGWILHMMVALIAIAWLGINFIYDISDITSANVAPNDPNFRFVNYARSPDWCILYGGQPGTQLICTNTAPCSGPGVLVENLKPNETFLFRFAINAFYTLFTVMILFYSGFQWEYGKSKSV
jgi:hypothetical protein